MYSEHKARGKSEKSSRRPFLNRLVDCVRICPGTCLGDCLANRLGNYLANCVAHCFERARLPAAPSLPPLQMRLQPPGNAEADAPPTSPTRARCVESKASPRPAVSPQKTRPAIRNNAPPDQPPTPPPQIPAPTNSAPSKLLSHEIPWASSRPPAWPPYSI